MQEILRIAEVTTGYPMTIKSCAEYDLQALLQTIADKARTMHINHTRASKKSDIKGAGVLLWISESEVILGFNPEKGWMDFGGKISQ